MQSDNPKLDKAEIAKQLQNGNIVEIPTETVWGYAVSLHSKTAIQNLMKKKDRDFNSGKVFTLVPESKTSIKKYAIINSKAKTLINKYLPGELTLILPKNPSFKNFYYDHFETIGIRIPDHELFHYLRKKSGPMLLTSANPRGGTPKTSTGHLPSTIVDLTTNTPKIIRQGNLNIDLNS